MSEQENDHIIKLKDGRKLAYAEYGDPEGQPLFFLHGWPSSRMHGRRMGEAASKLKIRIITPDRPGYGLSDYKENRTLLDYPDDILELADQLKIEKFAVVGVSGGGPYAAVCAYKIPTRITKVGIVVGLGPTHIKNAFYGTSIMAKLGWSNYGRVPLLPDLAALIQFTQTRYLPRFHKLGFRSKADQAMMDKDFNKSITKTTKEAFRQGIKGPALDLKLYTKDWGFDLGKIKSKVYLFYGADDKNVSLNMGKYYASKIPNSKLVVYPDEGHFIQITHAEEILKTLTS